MPIYSFYIFDRHCECIYKRQWLPRDQLLPRTPTTPNPPNTGDRRTSLAPSVALDAAANPAELRGRSGLSNKDDTKLVFGVIFSLRNMVRKLSGPEDNFISYRTPDYKLHYYETPTNLKFVMLSDVKTNNLRVVLHQIYVSLYVEYVVKNPLSRTIEHPKGKGVAVDLFEAGLDGFIKQIST
ncbi:putative TRAPP complex subunit [Ascobolus immersus RN42]|uniref:Trafficking protein particle complex subunit n=1 Tax=Ascobolus immersus RN42 TaxID=1160509 RepID=A0A3N4IE41_ASCIM|nr:putative TRAPP complex subunit [Ascobolus immersus RN42]